MRNWVQIRKRVHLGGPLGWSCNGIAMRNLWHGFAARARRERGQIAAAMLTGLSQQCGITEKNGLEIETDKAVVEVDGYTA